jgi:hypothetical protein
MRATPSSRITIRAQTVTCTSGTHTAGVRPTDADAFRAATAGTDLNARLLANTLTLNWTRWSPGRAAGTAPVGGRIT